MKAGVVAQLPNVVGARALRIGHATALVVMAALVVLFVAGLTVWQANRDELLPL